MNLPDGILNQHMAVLGKTGSGGHRRRPRLDYSARCSRSTRRMAGRSATGRNSLDTVRAGQSPKRSRSSTALTGFSEHRPA